MAVLRKKFRKCSLTGFTLIEILLVLVLLSIFVGLVIPRVGILFFDYEFHSTANKIEKLIRFASYSAILNKNIYRLNIDRTAKSFSLSQKKTVNGNSEFENVSGKAGSTLFLPQRVDLSNITADEIYFFPDGSSTASTITIKHSNDNTVSFVLKGFIHGFKVMYEE